MVHVNENHKGIWKIKLSMKFGEYGWNLNVSATDMTVH